MSKTEVTEEVKKMIADHMEAGFLENIIDMFKHDKTLFPLIGFLVSDERGRVRLGAVALAEELKKDFYPEMEKEIPRIAELLTAPNPTVRADTVYLLGVIGSKEALPYLREAEDDDNPLVRETVRETIEEINGSE